MLRSHTYSDRNTDFDAAAFDIDPAHDEHAARFAGLFPVEPDRRYRSERATCGERRCSALLLVRSVREPGQRFGR
jgi:hypothetical protein